MTNGERIRSMSDEELADFLDDVPGNVCECCSREQYDEKCESIACVDGIIEWLKQEV